MKSKVVGWVLVLSFAVVGYLFAVATMELWGDSFLLIPDGYLQSHRGVPVFRVVYEGVFVLSFVGAAVVIYRNMYNLDSVEDRVPSDLV